MTNSWLTGTPSEPRLLGIGSTEPNLLGGGVWVIPSFSWPKATAPMTLTFTSTTAHTNFTSLSKTAPIDAETAVDPRTPGQINAEVALNNDLGALHDLDPGWLDGEGALISRLAISKARRLLGDMLARGVASPHIFPTPEGGVQAQWSSDKSVLTITFRTDGSVRLFAKNLETRAVTRVTLEPVAVDS